VLSTTICLRSLGSNIFAVVASIPILSHRLASFVVFVNPIVGICWGLELYAAEVVSTPFLSTRSLGWVGTAFPALSCPFARPVFCLIDRFREVVVRAGDGVGGALPHSGIRSVRDSGVFIPRPSFLRRRAEVLVFSKLHLELISFLLRESARQA
jgi:hypothetical protein